MSPVESILDKIIKLQAHAESAAKIGNEHEAQAFADKAQSLLIDYKLELSDLELRRLDNEDPVLLHVPPIEDYLKAKVRLRDVRVGWISLLACGVAHGHFCRAVTIGGSAYAFVGRKSDAMIATYMYFTLCRMAEDIANVEYGNRWRECSATGDVTEARGFRRSFLIGFARRIAERYAERRKAVEVQYAANEHALVRLNSSEPGIRVWMNQNNMSMRPVTARIADREGFERGKESANNVDLNARAISRTGGEAKQLK